jgi:hypothetical protein
MASPIAEIRIGSLLKEIPSGETASLMALEIAAGTQDSRFHGTLRPNTVCGDGAVMHNLHFRHFVRGRSR